MAGCPVCGFENPEPAKFCSECGAALRPAVERREERKVVTVLFADLVGFTSRAQRLDPEDVRAVLAPYWARLRRELEQVGGTVEKFIGDAVMALFGAPVAHEDDPERAVRAALAIRDWVREEDDLQVRIAVNTGEALVLVDARPAEGEGMAAGDVVNTASRLQGAAPVNGVLVGLSTYRATRHVIEYAEREPVTAKGKDEPIPVWEALQARSRVGMDVEQRILLPLVGRERELATLLGAFERARRDSDAQLVTLVGVPGIGKSRLVAELYARLDASPELVWWRQGRALPYGQGVSFWALGEMVKAQAGINENDPTDVAAAKLRATVEAAVEARDAAWIERQLRPLVGLEQPQDGGVGRDESFAAWRRYLEGLAEQRPLVLVFEDLHWADDGLLDFVDHLADWAGGVPLLLLATARPELLDRRPGWGGGKLNATTLALTPLADDEAARIIGAVLEQALLPAETQQALLERAGGNPLYAEQFARLFVERGSSDELPLPETIQGIIAARLDGLGRDEKRLLQDAAVLGKVFWAGGAAELSGVDRAAVQATLHALERKGLVRRERRSAVGGEDEFAFRHVLVRDVAYGQIPRAGRSEKHVRAADWIESLGRADDHAELVAHHLSSALELARTGGGAGEELQARARRALRRAGERALGLNAFASAEQLFAEALELWPEDGERPYVLFGYARARYYAQGAAEAELDEATEALRAAGDAEAAAEAAAIAANSLWRAGRQAEAHERMAAARSLLQASRPTTALAAVLAELGRLHAFADERILAAEEGRQALALAEQLGLDGLRASALNTLGVVHFFEGDLAGAEALYQQVTEIESPSAALEVGRALTNLSVLSSLEGDMAEVELRYRRALEHATRIGNQNQLRWLEGYPAIRAYAEGRWDEALAHAEAFLANARRLGGHYHEHNTRIHRGLILAHRGDADGARRDLEHVLGTLGESSDLQLVMPALFAGTTIEVLSGHQARANELLDAAAESWRSGSARLLLVGSTDALAAIVRLGRAAEWLGLLGSGGDTRRMRNARLLLSGDWVAAADEVAYIDGPTGEAAFRLVAAEQLAAMGRAAEARAQLERALAFYRAVGAKHVVRHAEALLPQSA